MIFHSLLYGFSQDGLEPYEDTWLNPSAKSAFIELCLEAKSAGFDPQIVSGWRSFERQRVIWNAKALGQRKILDSNGVELDRNELTDEQAMWAILRWSALPGGSRHHWGTDFDVIDKAAVAENYQVQLTVDETQGSGPFAPFHQWLTGYLKERSDFFRPYTRLEGGVAPEPWHLSYAPAARQLQEQLSLKELATVIERSDIELKNKILDNLSEIYKRFTFVDWAQYPQRTQ